MLIHEFAERTGLTRDTIRFYEKRGLLTPAARGRANGYRHYGEAEVEAVQMIRIGQALGFSLAEIQLGAAAWRAGELTLELQTEMMAKKLAEVERKISELDDIRRYLSRKIAWTRDGQVGERPELEFTAADSCQKTP